MNYAHSGVCVCVCVCVYVCGRSEAYIIVSGPLMMAGLVVRGGAGEIEC